jgi:hypothetical protein
MHSMGGQLNLGITFINFFSAFSLFSCSIKLPMLFQDYFFFDDST